MFIVRADEHLDLSVRQLSLAITLTGHRPFYSGLCEQRLLKIFTINLFYASHDKSFVGELNGNFYYQTKVHWKL